MKGCMPRCRIIIAIAFEPGSRPASLWLFVFFVICCCAGVSGMLVALLLLARVHTLLDQYQWDGMHGY